jgi:hypothetical protein
MTFPIARDEARSESANLHLSRCVIQVTHKPRSLSENPGEIGSPRIFTEKNQCFTRALAVDSLIGS